MKKLILFGALCLVLPGCVGFVVPKTRTRVINNPEVSVFKGSVVDSVWESSGTNAPNPYSRTNCPAGWLRAHWGAPDLVCRLPANSDEIWTYKSDLAWKGIVPFVIIPIPLILPVTREKICFDLHDGHVVSASITTSYTAGGTYGFIPNPEGGSGFGTWNWDDNFTTPMP